MSHTELLRRLESIAQGRDDCISASEVAQAGATLDTVEDLIRAAAITRVVDGVYMLGAGPLTDRQLLQTALLVAGPGSAISHWSAAALHGLIEMDPTEAWVTTPKVCADRTVRTRIPVASTGVPADIHIISNRW